jgi:hypothetical protein
MSRAVRDLRLGEPASKTRASRAFELTAPRPRGAARPGRSARASRFRLQRQLGRRPPRCRHTDARDLLPAGELVIGAGEVVFGVWRRISCPRSRLPTGWTLAFSDASAPLAPSASVSALITAKIDGEARGRQALSSVPTGSIKSRFAQGTAALARSTPRGTADLRGEKLAEVIIGTLVGRWGLCGAVAALAQDRRMVGRRSCAWREEEAPARSWPPATICRTRDTAAYVVGCRHFELTGRGGD